MTSPTNRDEKDSNASPVVGAPEANEATREDSPRAGPLPPPTPPTKLERGMTLGRYVLLQQLGEGGMGVVFEAQDRELDRRVALKVLRSGEPDSGRFNSAWLLREAQALAKLSHPNVVAIYDVGVVCQLSYFTMELVRGQDLGSWLRASKRTWREILAVYIEAARGLAAAHATGLVHRDFKPENVLLGDDGRVRVTDFGLARPAKEMEDQRDSENSPPSGSPAAFADPREPSGSSKNYLSMALTQVGAVVGTASYLAPEQFEGAPAGPLTDQFSFGVALFYALYGIRPFRRDISHRSVERWQLQSPPPSDGDPPPWVEKLVKRAMSLAPSQRFESMDALIAALSKDPAIRRKRWLQVGLSIGAGLALTGGTAVYHWNQSQVCRGAERQFARVWNPQAQERIRAAFEQTGSPLAQNVVGHISRVVERYARSWTAMRTDACEATRLRGEQTEELLSLRMACLDGRLQNVAALVDVFESADEALVPRAVEATYALPTLAGCADVKALQAPFPLPASPDARAKIEKASQQAAKVRALYDSGRYMKGVEAAAAPILTAEQLGYRPLQADALYWQAASNYRLGENALAEEQFRRALHVADAGRVDWVRAAAAIGLGAVATVMERSREAAQWFDAAEATLLRMEGEPYLDYKLLMNRANLALAEGKRDEAFALDRRVYELARRVHGENDLLTAIALNNLAVSYEKAGRYEQAVESYKRSITMVEASLGAEHPSLADPLENLALSYQALDRYADASPPLVRASKIRALYQPRSIEDAHVRVMQAENALHHGSLHEVRASLEDANERYRTLVEAGSLEPKSPGILFLRIRELKVLLLQERYDVALQSLASIRKTFDVDDPRLEVKTDVHLAEARALQGLGRWKEARDHLERALEAAKAAAAANAVDVQMVSGALDALARWHLAQREAARALELHQEALALLGKPGRRFPDIEASVREGLGLSQLASEDVESARKTLEKAHAAIAHRPPMNPLLASTRLALARALKSGAAPREHWTKLGSRSLDTAEALEQREQSREIRHFLSER